ncbi:hypothetical protein HY991_01165 [Candidatus Micrarchaeota archaeon]|nr:hypothetical protein [Candidatus Micrarchaeota archaeon]
MARLKKVGIFSLTSCEGCQLQILDLEKRLLDLLDFIEIDYFKLAEERSRMEYFDIAFVEGAVSTIHEREKLETVRKNSKYLVAIGACACHGGIPSLRNLIKTTGGRGYHPISSSKTVAINKFVKVDYYLRGCPIEKEEFASFLLMLLRGKVPLEVNSPVCGECNNREIECLLRKGIPCLGPITASGCNAVCPEHSTPCEGCRGTIEDANIFSLVDSLKSLGLPERDIENKLHKFASSLLIGKGRSSRPFRGKGNYSPVDCRKRGASLDWGKKKCNLL